MRNNRKIWLTKNGQIPQGMCIMQLGDDLIIVPKRSQCRYAMIYRFKRHLTSLYTGVCKHGSKWQSRIVVDSKRLHLGLFDTEEQAHLAYQTKLAEINHSENPKEA